VKISHIFGADSGGNLVWCEIILNEEILLSGSTVVCDSAANR